MLFRSWPTGIAPLSVKDENAWLEVKPNVNWLVALPVLALPDAKPVVPPKIWVSVWLPPPTKLIVIWIFEPFCPGLRSHRPMTPSIELPLVKLMVVVCAGLDVELTTSFHTPPDTLCVAPGTDGVMVKIELTALKFSTAVKV